MSTAATRGIKRFDAFYAISHRTGAPTNIIHSCPPNPGPAPLAIVLAGHHVVLDAALVDAAPDAEVPVK